MIATSLRNIIFILKVGHCYLIRYEFMWSTLTGTQSIYLQSTINVLVLFGFIIKNSISALENSRKQINQQLMVRRTTSVIATLISDSLVDDKECSYL